MQGTHYWVYAIGFTAQMLFSARLLHQWIVTEKAKKVLSPPAFWILSIVGSFLLFIYGLLYLFVESEHARTLGKNFYDIKGFFVVDSNYCYRNYAPRFISIYQCLFSE